MQSGHASGFACGVLKQVQHDSLNFVILSDSEGSSSASRAAIQSEEDASFLSMTKFYYSRPRVDGTHKAGKTLK